MQRDEAELAAMHRALALGETVRGRTSPNPPVGAVVLYVEADNAAAVRLYRDLGFERFSADVSYRR